VTKRRNRRSSRSNILLRSVLLGGTSALAIGGFAAPSLGQQTMETVVVTGLRGSLENSQQIKQDASVFVDAVTAEDIGALPDTNMSDTLQRIPGVAINHFAGTTDPDHFSAEGSGIVIRGLSYVEGEFNGRDTFSVSDGRGLSFGDIPTELWGTVLTYKNQSADMIEGGIAGTVDLHSRMPFDSDKRVISLSAREEYGDLVKRAAPSVFGLFSDTWDTNIGKVGLLVAGNHSQEWTRGDGSQVAAYGANNNQISPGNTVYLPVGPDVRTDVYDYQHTGWDATAQWQSPDGRMRATLSFVRAQSDTNWTEHDVQIEADVVNGGGAIPPVPGNAISANRLSPICTAATDCNPWGGQPAFAANQFNSQGLFTHGTISQYRGSWSWGGDNSTPNWGEPAEAQTRGVKQKIVTEDYGANFKWDATDRLHIELDWHHVDSTSENLDDTVGFTVFVEDSLQNVNAGGGLPSLTFVPSLMIPSQAPNITTNEYYSDPGNYFWRDNMDHMEHSGGIEDAYKVDLKYDVDEGWLRSVKFGARYSNQSQTVRYTAYNWGVVSEVWAGPGAIWFAQPTALDSVDPTDTFDGATGQSRIHPTNQLNALGASVLSTFTFDNFQRGAVPHPIEGEFYYANPARNYATLTKQALATNAQWVANGGSAGWVPLTSRPGVIPGTPYLPAEINSNVETVWAGYAMADFATDSLFGTSMSLDGNLGVRFVDTRDYAGPGWTQFPSASTFNQATQGSCTPAPSPFPGVVISYTSPVCSLTPEQRADAAAFANGALVPIAAAVHHHDNVLPSLNALLHLTDDMQIRLGLSESISRPDMGLMRNSVVFQGVSSPFAWQVFGGNPALKPVRGDNLDLSFEWYFSKTGSFTFSPFFKQLHGVITNNFSHATYTNGVSPATGTSPGAPNSYDVIVQNEYNAPSGGKVRGFEVAYQQFYDFLPSPFDGFGVNANFTYIDSTGVPQGNFASANPNPVVVAGSGCLVNGAPAPCTLVDVSKLPLQGLSRYNYNATGMYQKGPYELRLAWDWRSTYLLTTRDVIYPFLPIMAVGNGTLDGSFFYSIGDTWKVGLEATNLTNSTTKTEQVLTNSLRAGRSWFITDREITFSIRAQF
jgi:TonB-dependent receptor